MSKKLYKQIASSFTAYLNCKKQRDAILSAYSDDVPSAELGAGDRYRNVTEWKRKHADNIRDLVREYMPSGSGFDAGTKFSFELSTPEKLVFTTSYHHMDSNGYYCGWTEHTVYVRPSLQFDYTLSISGRNRNDIKEYMYEQFRCSLDTNVE